MFGDHVHVPASSAAAEAIAATCRGAAWTVGWFVPDHHAAIVRLAPPDPDVRDWWADYRALFVTVAAVGAAHTTTPDRAWFGIWEGHGWESRTTVIASSGPLTEAGRAEAARLQAVARADDDRWQQLIRSGIRGMRRFHLPDRTYYLMEGPVAAVTELREPGTADVWQRPDLFWPDDRAWHVATDVDFWSLYVAGSEEFVTDVVAAVRVPTTRVTLTTRLVAED